MFLKKDDTVLFFILRLPVVLPSSLSIEMGVRKVLGQYQNTLISGPNVLNDGKSSGPICSAVDMPPDGNPSAP